MYPLEQLQQQINHVLGCGPLHGMGGAASDTRYSTNTTSSPGTGPACTALGQQQQVANGATGPSLFNTNTMGNPMPPMSAGTMQQHLQFYPAPHQQHPSCNYDISSRISGKSATEELLGPGGPLFGSNNNLQQAGYGSNGFPLPGNCTSDARSTLSSNQALPALFAATGGPGSLHLGHAANQTNQTTNNIAPNGAIESTALGVVGGPLLPDLPPPMPPGFNHPGPHSQGTFGGNTVLPLPGTAPDHIMEGLRSGAPAGYGAPFGNDITASAGGNYKGSSAGLPTLPGASWFPMASHMPMFPPAPSSISGMPPGLNYPAPGLQFAAAPMPPVSDHQRGLATGEHGTGLATDGTAAPSGMPSSNSNANRNSYTKKEVPDLDYAFTANALSRTVSTPMASWNGNAGKGTPANGISSREGYGYAEPHLRKNGAPPKVLTRDHKKATEGAGVTERSWTNGTRSEARGKGAATGSGGALQDKSPHVVEIQRSSRTDLRNGLPPPPRGRHPQPPPPPPTLLQEQDISAKKSPCKDPPPAPAPLPPGSAQANSQASKYQRFEADGDGKTTVMIRNIPNVLTQDDLLDTIDLMGFANKYNFFYLPIDFSSKANCGYAFINFFFECDLEPFMKGFHGISLHSKSQKITQCVPAQLQGYQSNIAYYRNSAMNRDVIPAEFKPVLFAPDGERLQLPPPDQDLRPILPKMKKSTTGGRESGRQGDGDAPSGGGFKNVAGYSQTSGSAGPPPTPPPPPPKAARVGTSRYQQKRGAVGSGASANHHGSVSAAPGYNNHQSADAGPAASSSSSSCYYGKYATTAANSSYVDHQHAELSSGAATGYAATHQSSNPSGADHMYYTSSAYHHGSTTAANYYSWYESGA
ncbi:unnamed protein product [Amoebophrya sp. A25]|nr:unnamed protein product [Amoebophrya sp. A25]|eukprot:GSA25T00001069001.1